ncbi:FHA domain-containing protein [Leptolyngbya sp. 7M]|uniref:FHA domain-containing protein n=1 Tax=Leptolyngbya sp. 7M TaxID=2812896 RepID=UPI001B8D89CB|nr:FHA domain-containing protein [Leptolyngbya sp. 7M]QYO67918.1 FHA domain-containing protein [Leptolyngbya sp. 7M]
MANRNELAAYTSSLVNMSEYAELQERLKLYQVFQKLYEHHRGLLDEILDLENSSSTSVGMTSAYVQGFMSDEQGYLVTNLMQGKTQALMQPQQTWIIGRDPRRSFISIQDIRLSRCHAAIRYVPHQGFYLIDLGSRNHSFVNGELVRQVLLRDGDQVRLGSVAFTFFLCQSTKTLEPLPSEVVSRLAHHQAAAQATASEVGIAVQVVSEQAEDVEEDSIPTLDLYHETSGFLRLGDSE